MVRNCFFLVLLQCTLDSSISFADELGEPAPPSAIEEDLPTPPSEVESEVPTPAEMAAIHKAHAESRALLTQFLDTQQSILNGKIPGQTTIAMEAVLTVAITPTPENGPNIKDIQKRARSLLSQQLDKPDRWYIAAEKYATLVGDEDVRVELLEQINNHADQFIRRFFAHVVSAEAYRDDASVRSQFLDLIGSHPDKAIQEIALNTIYKIVEARVKASETIYTPESPLREIAKRMHELSSSPDSLVASSARKQLQAIFSGKIETLAQVESQDGEVPRSGPVTATSGVPTATSPSNTSIFATQARGVTTTRQYVMPPQPQYTDGNHDNDFSGEDFSLTGEEDGFPTGFDSSNRGARGAGTNTGTNTGAPGALGARFVPPRGTPRSGFAPISNSITPSGLVPGAPSTLNPPRSGN